MSVYVGVPMWLFGRMVMCHMVADSEEEMDAMAVRLGIRRWKQLPKREQGVAGLAHYDIAKSKRAQAVKLGAIALDAVGEEAEVLWRLAEAKDARRGK
jgi:hypothetical protein